MGPRRGPESFPELADVAGRSSSYGASAGQALHGRRGGVHDGNPAPVTEALRRCQARTFDLVASDPQRTGPVVLVLSPQLEVRAHTAETDTYLRTLVPPDADRPPIPSGRTDTHRIAEQMFVSEHTVQDHLKSIFAKTATRNRRTLLARSAGR